MSSRYGLMALTLGILALSGCGALTPVNGLAASPTKARATSVTATPLPTVVTEQITPNLAYGELVLQAAMARDTAAWRMGYNLLEPGTIHVDEVPPGQSSHILTAMDGYRWDDPQQNGYRLYLSGDYDAHTGKVTFKLDKTVPL